MITAPAAATTGPSTPPVLASAGGPSFRSGPAAGTVFPLLRTTLLLEPSLVSADAATNAVGGTARVVGGKFTIDISAYSGGYEPTWSGYDNLDYTRVGYWSTGGAWDYWEDTVRHRGVLVAGYETPASAMPTTGSATYAGQAFGSVFVPTINGTGATGECRCLEAFVAGDASFTAYFGAGSIVGALTGMSVTHPGDGSAPGDPWNNVSFTATIVGNKFNGFSEVTTSPTTWAALTPNAAGTVEGKFFGPSAQEAGAVWTLFDGTSAAIGTFTGKRP